MSQVKDSSNIRLREPYALEDARKGSGADP